MKHFTIAELSRSTTATSKGIDNIPPSGVIIALTALVEKVLDPAREAFGAPILVNSGYRSLALNKAVGGAATSQHLRGEAADLDTGSREGNRRLFEIIKARGVFDQLIDEKDFAWVHVSYRANGINRKQTLKIK